MKTIHYADDSLMTGDAIADAMIRYAKSLAQHGGSDSVEIPVVTQEGERAIATFLRGPASQVVALWPHEFSSHDLS